MKENMFLEIIKKTLPESACFIGDDTAYIAEKDLILTQDTLIEDVHFRTSTISPYFLGRKSMAVNLSDIAAAGGLPSYALISLSLPENINESFIEEFYKGIHDISSEYGVVVVGGDLTKAFKITISICLIGFGKGIIPASRKNAKIGDFVIVTGSFGSSRAGFEILEKNIDFPEKSVKNDFVMSHINPIPRLEEGRKIIEFCPKAALMDASDGLADALTKLCFFSNVGMQIDFEDIPHNSQIINIAKNESELFKWVLFGGEDYELVGTVLPEEYEKLLNSGILIKKIGIVTESINNSYPYIKFNDKTVKIDENLMRNEIFSHFK